MYYGADDPRFTLGLPHLVSALEAKYDEQLSSLAFNVNLRPCYPDELLPTTWTPIAEKLNGQVAMAGGSVRTSPRPTLCADQLTFSFARL